ncbi:hypothetical protein M9458_009033, partial [Cirrhinus mrigala]
CDRRPDCKTEQRNMSTETPIGTNPFALKAAFQPPSAPPSVSGSPMAMPATFAGEAAECSGFILQVNLFIKMQPQLFTSEDAKVAFLISLLTGKALQWAKAIWNAENSIIHSYEQFTNHSSEVFSTTTGELSTSDQLFRLQQGKSPVNQYTLHFRMLAAASGWNEKALLGAYRQGILVAQYIQSCSVCAMSTSPRQLPTGKLVPLPIPQRPWSHIGVDFVTDLPAAEGNTCILVMVDRFFKMCKFFPLKGLPTAMETADILFQHLFRHFGLPEEIVSDRGLQFISHVWKAFFKLLGVSVNLSSGYHPQTNGQTETKIQELGRYLRAYCHTDQHCWSKFLPWAEYAQNSLRQDTTGLTPFQCVLRYQPPLFPWTEEPSNVPASERVWVSAHHHLQRAV